MHKNWILKFQKIGVQMIPFWTEKEKPTNVKPMDTEKLHFETDESGLIIVSKFLIIKFIWQLNF